MRIVNIISKLKKYYPIGSIVGELNKFDTQKMLNSEISGVLYQRGNLQGFEVREYLLQKYKYTCVYCKRSAFKHKDIRLEIDHVLPVSKGGSNKVSNLALSCQTCNKSKSNHLIEVFLIKKPQLLKEVIASLGKTLNLQDAAQMNIMRKELYQVLAKRLSLSVETYPASHTKFNRKSQQYIKDHWLDAVCTGESGRDIDIKNIKQISIYSAKGRGNRQMCLMDKFGFPRGRAKSVKRYKAQDNISYQSGDRVKLVQKTGKYKGTHKGVVSIRVSGRFDIKNSKGEKITSNVKNFTKLDNFNGYIISNKNIKESNYG